MNTLFSDAHIKTLREEYAKVKTVSVEPGSSGDKLRKFVGSLPDDVLKQLRDANIKFVSPLALAVLITRKHPLKKS